MKSRSGWILCATAVALAIFGAVWHPTAFQTLGIVMVFLFLVGLFFFSDRLECIESKLDAISQQEK